MSGLDPGVVGQGHLVLLDAAGSRRARRLPANWTVADVAELAAAAGVTVVYLYDEANHDPDLPLGQVGAGSGWAAMATSGTQEAEPWRWRVTDLGSFRTEGGTLTIPPRADRREVSIVSVPRDKAEQAGPWASLSPGEALDAFRVFSGLAGVPWSDGIGRTAEQLILATHPIRRGGVRLDRSPLVPKPAEDNALEGPYGAWHRPLAEAERRPGQTVHYFDASAQYLAAWVVVELGHGQPALHRLPAFDPRQVGIWRVSNIDALRNPDPSLPPAWLPGREWVTTPTLIRMHEVLDGYAVPELAEAWIWPGHSRWLRPAAERIRDARKQAAQLAAPLPRAQVGGMSHETLADYLSGLARAGAVLDALKALYVIQTGRLGMSARDARSGWRRPDWANLVRAQARANLHRRLAKLSVRPVAIATDALLFLDDEPEPLKFATRIGLPIGIGLGQYTHEGSAPRWVVDELLGERRRPRGAPPMAERLFAAVGRYAQLVSEQGGGAP